MIQEREVCIMSGTEKIILAAFMDKSKETGVIDLIKTKGRSAVLFSMGFFTGLRPGSVHFML